MMHCICVMKKKVSIKVKKIRNLKKKLKSEKKSKSE